MTIRVGQWDQKYLSSVSTMWECQKTLINTESNRENAKISNLPGNMVVGMGAGTGVGAGPGPPLFEIGYLGLSGYCVYIYI